MGIGICREMTQVYDNRREMGFNQQALYCYGKVHSLDPSNLNALWDRAALAKEIGDNRTVGIFVALHLLVLSQTRQGIRCWRC